MKAPKRRIFIDMDGVLAWFYADKSIEEWSAPGYFEALAAHENVCEAINQMIVEEPEYEYFILSAAFNNTAKEEKLRWAAKMLPQIPTDHILITPYGKTKSQTVLEKTGVIRESDILLDDFSDNLRAWHGVGIKILNTINDTKKTWIGYVINGRGSKDVIRVSLSALAAAA